VDAARQSAGSTVRSATFEVAAATAACEAAGNAGPVAPLRDVSTLLAKLLAANPLDARGTTSYASAALGDAASASTAVLRAVDAVTVPPRRPRAAVTGDGGAADASARAAKATDNAAVVACRRLCARARHAASSVLSAAELLIPMANPDAGDHPADDAGAGVGGAPTSVGGGTRGRLRRCGGCGTTGHNVKTCPADASAKAAHAARVVADVAAKGARAGSGRIKCGACHVRGHTRASAACPLRAVAHGWSGHNEDRGRNLACADQYRMAGDVTTTVAVSIDRFFGVWRWRLPGPPADCPPPAGRSPTTSAHREKEASAEALSNAAAAGAAALTKLATAQTQHLRLVPVVMDGTMRYLFGRVDGGGLSAGGGGGRRTLDEFMAALPASLTGSHGLAWKQVASTVSCRGVRAFGGAPRRACASCSGRGAHVKQRGDVRAATGADDYTTFVAASAAVAADVTEPEHLPCSTLLPSPADTGGWATGATSFVYHYVTHVTWPVKAITKCIVLDVYPQTPGGSDGHPRAALVDTLVAGLHTADGSRPPVVEWPAGTPAADGKTRAAAAAMAYDTVLVYMDGGGRRRSLLHIDKLALRQRPLHVYPLLHYAQALCVGAGIEAADTSPGRAATCTAYARVGGALLRKRLAAHGGSTPPKKAAGLVVQTLLRRAGIIRASTVVGHSIVSDGVGVHFSIRHPATAASTAAARRARRRAASGGRGAGGPTETASVRTQLDRMAFAPDVVKALVFVGWDPGVAAIVAAYCPGAVPFALPPAPHLHVYRAYRALLVAADALARAAMAATAAAECHVRRDGRFLPTVDAPRATVAEAARAAVATASDAPVGGGDAVCRTTKKRGRGALGVSTGAEGSPPKQSCGALVGPPAATPAVQSSFAVAFGALTDAAGCYAGPPPLPKPTQAAEVHAAGIRRRVADARPAARGRPQAGNERPRRPAAAADAPARARTRRGPRRRRPTVAPPQPRVCVDGRGGPVQSVD